MNRRSASVLGFSRATRSISGSSPESCCCSSCSVGSFMPGVVACDSPLGVKKVGQAHFSKRIGTEKLAISIALLTRRPARIFPQPVDLVQDRLGDLLLGGDRDLALPLGRDQGHRIALALEADLRIGD